MAKVRRRIVVHGEVQGVFFRDGSSQQASQRGLTGWVRNRDDGSVETEVQGEQGAVEAFLAWAGQGPDAATVDSVDVDDRALAEGETGFEVR